MKKYSNILCALSLIAAMSVLLVPGSIAQAGSSLPTAVHFGFGAQINPHTDNMDLVVRGASQMGFNWLAVNFDWSLQWSDPSQSIDLNQLNQAVFASRPYQASLMVTIKNPPAWVLTPQGPNADYVTALVIAISQSFPDTIGAIELFPGANQASQWGAPANPAYYAHVIKQAQSNLTLKNPRALVVASITPLGENRQDGDMDDLDFLAAVYQSAGDQRFPVIGLGFSATSGEPTQDPLTDSAHNLRHYESVRKIMLENGRSTDLIWVTKFSWPASLTNNQQQADWLFNAYKLLRTQLYIGAAFFENLNSNDPASAGSFLINQNVITHPAVNLLRQLTAIDQAGSYDPVNSYDQAASEEPDFLVQFWRKILSWLGL